MSQSGLQRTPWHFGDTLSRSVAAAIVPVLACLLATNGVAAKEFPPVGGAGDATFRDLCPANTFLVGLIVRAGSWVDQMSILCARPDWEPRPLRPDERNDPFAATPFSHGPVRGGEGGFDQAPGYCAPGQIINHMGFSLTSGNKQVLFFHFGCRSTTNNQTGTFDLGPKSPVFPSINQDCPNGEAATGIQGRAGKHVNAVGLICGPLSAGSGYSLPPASPQQAFCSAYAAAAVQSQKEASSAGCGFSSGPGRWSSNEDEHYNACQAWGAQTTRTGIAETNARAQDLSACRAGKLGVAPNQQFPATTAVSSTVSLDVFCQDYAKLATFQINEAKALSCSNLNLAHAGYRWDTVEQHHHDACMGWAKQLRASNAAGQTAAAEMNGREFDLLNCKKQGFKPPPR
jgi:hypothetical protein